MEATFDFAMPKLLVHEGGYVNHPQDPGGATNKGVTQRVYDAFRRRKGLSTQTVKNITVNEVFEIYRTQYWDAVKGDSLPQGVDYVVFDGAANSGPVQSIKWLQRALGVTADGMIGQATMRALEAVNDHDALIAKIIERRDKFLRALKTFKTFGKGWTRRIAQVQKIGQEWAFGSVGPTPTYFEGGGTKAVIADAKPRPSKAVADGATGGGVAGITLTGALQAAKDTLTPLAEGNAFVSNTLAIVAGVSVLAAAAGVVYRLYAKRKDADLVDALDLGTSA